MSRFSSESLIQLGVFTVLGYTILANLPVERNFFVVFTVWLLLLSLVGGGWPFSVPYGRPFKRLWVSGTAMTLILFTTSVVSYALLSSVGLVSLAEVWFWVIANWSLLFESWPMRHHTPRTALLVGTVFTLAVALGMHLFFTLFPPTGFLMLLMHTQLAVAALFSPFFIFQGYPFYRLWRQPRIGLGIFVVSMAVGLGIVTSPWLSAPHIQLLFSGIFLWSVLYSWAFGYPLTLKYGQPVRGFLTVPLAMSIAIAWSYSLTVFLPVERVVELNLYVVLPAFIIHNTFWFRMPFSPPLLLGMPPQQHKKLDTLFEWMSQIKN